MPAPLRCLLVAECFADLSPKCAGEWQAWLTHGLLLQLGLEKPIMKIIQITDLHLVQSGRQLKRLNPEQRLRDCLSDIQEKHQDAVALVVPGDIAETGDQAAYELFRDILKEYKLPPVHATIGNHDHRQNFANIFPSEIDPSSGFAQSSFSLGDHRGLLLDTWDSGQHSGLLCKQRLLWLDEQLKNDARPTFLFMHHAPFRVGMKRLDQIPLVNGRELIATIEPFRDRIHHIFFGHMHRNISGSWHGFPFTVVAGTTHQLMLDFETELVREAVVDPSYAVILIDDGTTIVHLNQVREHWDVIDRKPGPTNDTPHADFDLAN